MSEHSYHGATSLKSKPLQHKQTKINSNIQTHGYFYFIFVKLPFHLRQVTYLFASYLFVSTALSCPIFEKDNFIENLYIVLSCLIK